MQKVFLYFQRPHYSQQSRIIYKVNCWDCNGFYISKTKRRLHHGRKILTYTYKGVYAKSRNNANGGAADRMQQSFVHLLWAKGKRITKGNDQI